MAESFNLLEKGWIPVLFGNGEVCRVGITEAFTKAGQIRQIATSNPMDRIAVLRFLLALLYWCKGNPPSDRSELPRDSFPADWFSKLNQNKECFDLLGDGKRFYQDRSGVRVARTEKGKEAVMYLIQEIPTGNNFWHFRHSTDRQDGLCIACCAMGLLRLPLFFAMGGRGYPPGINGAPPLYVLPCGKSLLDTLLANWHVVDDLGDPAWLDPTVRPPQGQPVPMLTGLTLLSRRVWLSDPTPPPGMCIVCGAREQALIRTCEFQTAGRQENELWNDPHVVYLDKTPRRGLRASDPTAPRGFTMDRPWLDLLARVVETRKFGAEHSDTPLLVVGFATKKALSIDVWERTLVLPARASFKNDPVALLRRWGRWPSHFKSTLSNILRPKSQKVSNLGAATASVVCPQVEGRVSSNVSVLLAGGNEAWERAADEYPRLVQSVARSLSPGFTTAAVQRRMQIAAVKPNVQADKQSRKKQTRKKGGAE